ncbi:MAG TPA: YhgN family NAAT transporter [Pyrinomonadaceae bacterium]|nr:YhgN family NAAT transporter [Chloracidobacterium sp.]MBP9108067.1 YhgN family NAAT transporter [Pyrinomonadaceae bacterium]MBK7802017.1 YhgN family NAAT transporter [Chloracidobacterium sp.]MBK9437838.1 YhgN family NAAT transporter [Chloracidobacterium sp.]MBK9765744.1 YhgN family NAAT transporter [Chloracidobacterium sp.]
MEILFAALTLFLIMDPIGNIPPFLAVLKDVPTERRRPVLIRELLLALGILLLFLFLGGYILQLLGLRQESISIAGGIILFIIAIRMIFPVEGGLVGETPEGEPFLVPLAVPLVAGPSVLASILLLKQSSNLGTAGLLGAVSIAWAVSAAILISAPYLLKLLKQRGLIAMERLMGMLLVILSVQMFLDGISAFMKK